MRALLGEDATTTQSITQPIVKGSVEQRVLANGTMEADRTLNVGAQAAGRITALHVSLGQPVKEGELIAETESMAQQNALRVAEATLAELRAQRNAKDAQLEEAEKTLQRAQSLSSKRAGTIASLETSVAAVKVLQAEIEALSAQIGKAVVEVEDAQVQLGYTRITAPMDGIVVAIVAKEGQTLNLNQTSPTIVTLARIDRINVKVQISEADVLKVRSGQKLSFTLLGDSLKEREAVLDQIEYVPTSPSGDTTASLTPNTAVYYNAWFEVANSDLALRPGMSAQVAIVTGRAEGVPLVPYAALRARQDDGRYRVVLSRPGGGSENRLVSIGLTDHIRAEVKDGLAIGDQVVIPADGEASSVEGFGP